MLKIFADMLNNVGVKGEVDGKVFYGEADFNNAEVCELTDKLSEVAVDVEDHYDSLIIKFPHFKIELKDINAED